MTINEISKPIDKHLTEFNKYFASLMQSDVPLLNLILKYINQKRGKQIRPAILFLSAELCGGANPRSYTGAALVELLHTATLVHDDVVDKASERRGMASINAEWNNKIAVLIGDFLLAKGLLTAIDSIEFNFLKATSKAVRRMSEGELLSIEKSMSLKVTEEIYFRITADKTASLMASCCEIGAISATDDTQKQEALRHYGELMGIAFQIKDDIFDYLSKSFTIGKPVGNDLKEKKVTLPLIYASSKAPAARTREVKKIIKTGNLKKKDIKLVLDFVNEFGGIDYAEEKAREYTGRAKLALNIFDDSPAKQSLINLADFVIERKS